MSSKKEKLDNRASDHHFFASTFTDWACAHSMIDLFKKLPISDIGKKVRFISIWRVPCPMDASYRIENHAPCVEGAVLLYLDNGGDPERDHEFFNDSIRREKKNRDWVTIDHSVDVDE